MTENQVNVNCECKKKCERHGKCVECEAHHKSIKTKTHCKRKLEK